MIPETITRTELHLAPLLPAWGLGIAAVLALLLLALAWRGSAGVRAGRRVGLLALRLLPLLLLGGILAGPERVATQGRPARDPLVVLLDASRSMQVRDSGGRARIEEVSAWLGGQEGAIEELQRDYDVRLFAVGERIEPLALPQGDGAGGGTRLQAEVAEGIAVDGAGGTVGGGGDYPAAGAAGGAEAGPVLAADGATTDLGQGLMGLDSVLPGSRPAGVLLVSDGADRAALGRALLSGGPEAAGKLVSGLKFPVSTWAVGDPAGPVDLAVRTVAAPPFGFVRRPLTIEAEIASRGLPARRVQVALHGEEGLLAAQDVDFDAQAQASASFEVVPDRIGYHTWRVSVDVPDGDTIPANNEVEVTVKVVRDRTRVLQVTSRPSWDVKFLRQLLKTDPNIDLVSFFILRTGESRGLSRREDLSLIAFPYDELFTEDLQGFDLVVFQNFWFGSFAQFYDGLLMDNLARYVEEGGALLMVGGDLSFGAAAYGESPLGRVLPTAVPRVQPGEQPFRAALTNAGRRHPVTRLDRDADASALRWAALPALQGWNPLGEPQEGGVVLATAGEGGDPLIAVRQVGRGRTMAFATDTSWRWAIAGANGPGSGRDHAGFWRGAVRWLVQDAEQRQVQVTTDKENYRLGETIQAQVQVLSFDFAPRAGAALQVRVGPVSRQDAATVVDGHTDADGQFGFSLPADREGTLAIAAEVPEIGDPWGRAEARVSVTDRGGEMEDPRVRRDLLEAIALATGGRAWTSPPDLRYVARKPGGALLAVDRRSEPIWSHWAVLLALASGMGIEWVLRRRSGLR